MAAVAGGNDEDDIASGAFFVVHLFAAVVVVATAVILGVGVVVALSKLPFFTRAGRQRMRSPAGDHSCDCHAYSAHWISETAKP